jgi:DNA-directed RNA polymerase specialized sigma24 family protein
VVRALFTDERTPYAEVARATGIPVGSLGPTRARVLRQLRQLLEEDGSVPRGAARAC